MATLTSYTVQDLLDAPKGNPRYIFEKAKQLLRSHPEVTVVTGPHCGEKAKVDRLELDQDGTISCRVTVPSEERAGQRVGFWTSTRALKPGVAVPETLESIFAAA